MSLTSSQLSLSSASSSSFSAKAVEVLFQDSTPGVGDGGWFEARVVQTRDAAPTQLCQFADGSLLWIDEACLRAPVQRNTSADADAGEPVCECGAAVLDERALKLRRDADAKNVSTTADAVSAANASTAATASSTATEEEATWVACDRCSRWHHATCTDSIELDSVAGEWYW